MKSHGSLALVFLLLFWALTPWHLIAFNIGTTAIATASTESANPLYVDLRVGLEHESETFDLDCELSFDTSGTYKAPYFGDYFGDFSVDIQRAGFSYNKDEWAVILGYTPLKDMVESPYSLFQNASGLPALGIEVRYEDDGFFYRDRWILLNKDLKTTLYTSSDRNIGSLSEDMDIYDDRGAVLRTYGIKKGNIRFGYQDSVLFTDEFFDFNYFANPIPSIFSQYIAKAPGRPWSRTEGDHNTIMGFFADYSDYYHYVYAQILVDDLNTNRFLNPSGPQSPDKIAWSIGGHKKSLLGTFGLYHAGATKYTFESAVGKYYSYTLYPGSVVLWKDTESPILVEDNMLGYLHGENNISFLGTWKGGLGNIDLGASVELSISGSKSPANPWHEYDNIDEEGRCTRLLDDPVLEKKIVLDLESGLALGKLYFGIAGKIGYVANRLKVVAVSISDEDGNAQPIFEPSNESGFIGEISIFGRYIL